MSNKLYCHDAVTCIVIGQQFTWHYDAIQPHLKDSSGNRIATLIVYLNDCKSGGETAFRDLDLKVRVGIFDAFLILSAIPLPLVIKCALEGVLIEFILSQIICLNVMPAHYAYSLLSLTKSVSFNI